MNENQTRWMMTLLLGALCSVLSPACGEDETTTCGLNGVTYAVGESVPAADGCNTCVCGDSGIGGCTEMDCPPIECGPEDCEPAPGMANYLCDDGETTAGPSACEAQDDGTCGWTIVTCPETGTSCDGVDCPESHACVDGECVYEPCLDLACGAPCSLCPPNDEDCVETAEEKACNGQGVCEGSFDGSQCEENLCPEPECDSWDPYCEDGLLYGGGVSMCDPATGECLPSPGMPPEECVFGCDDGACLEDPCGDIDLFCPEGTVCYGGSCVATCETGESFLADDGCNTCVCPDSGWKDESLCTEQDCTDTCVPGESFDDDDGCNTCICPDSGDKGKANCTKKACMCDTNDDCGGSAFCDFSYDDCGVWGPKGMCAALPEACIGGGVGACGCDGSWATNGCELNAQGVDEMKYGGCQGVDPVALFACGDTECNIETQFCSISPNDAINPDGSIEPEYYSNCGELPAGCPSGDCSCMTLDELESCYDGTGYTMMFYPGG